MKNIIVMTITVLFIFVGCSTVYAFGVAKINVKVVDEYGSTIDNTKLRVRFSSGEMPVLNFTDGQGSCSITSNSSEGVVVGTAIKDGYYESTFHHDFHVRKFGMWQPWGKEITVVMRPIINPVSMFVRNRSFEIPAVDKEIGFDLMKADWVIPYGQGAQSDFIFRVEHKYNNINDFDCTLIMTFTNQYDGIQLYKEDPGGDFNAGSQYRLPRTAPRDGYKTKLVKRFAAGSSAGATGWLRDYAIDNNYFFRVRSEIDKDGNLSQAMYGKILGDIKYAPKGGSGNRNGAGSIEMHYYLNPDYSHNLEFDPKRNLFVIISTSENVLAP